MGRRPQSKPLRQHQPQDLTRLGIFGQGLARGAVDQRVEIDKPAQGFARDRAGERLVLELADVGGRRAEGDVQRLAPPQDGIEQAKRGAARVDSGGLGHGRSPLEHRAKKWEPVFRIGDAAPGASLETSRQPAHFLNMEKRATKRPETFEKPANWTSEPPPKPQKPEMDEELSPTRYGDWVKDGIAIDF